MRVDSQKKKSSQVSMKVKKQTRAAMMKQRQDAAAKLQSVRERRTASEQQNPSWAGGFSKWTTSTCSQVRGSAGTATSGRSSR